MACAAQRIVHVQIVPACILALVQQNFEFRATPISSPAPQNRSERRLADAAILFLARISLGRFARHVSLIARGVLRIPQEGALHADTRSRRPQKPQANQESMCADIGRPLVDLFPNYSFAFSVTSDDLSDKPRIPTVGPSLDKRQLAETQNTKAAEVAEFCSTIP